MSGYRLVKMVKYVLLCLLRPELVGQDVEASSREARQQLSDERLIRLVGKDWKDFQSWFDFTADLTGARRG
jgi:hypothetical protein